MPGGRDLDAAVPVDPGKCGNAEATGSDATVGVSRGWEYPMASDFLLPAHFGLYVAPVGAAAPAVGGTGGAGGPGSGVAPSQDVSWHRHAAGN